MSGIFNATVFNTVVFNTVEVAAPDVFGWGPRGRLGAAVASLETPVIGSNPAHDKFTRIGADTASATPAKIGSPSA